MHREHTKKVLVKLGRVRLRLSNYSRVKAFKVVVGNVAHANSIVQNGDEISNHLRFYGSDGLRPRWTPYFSEK